MGLTSLTVLVLFNVSAYIKYILPEDSFDEEYIKHCKSTLAAVCEIFGSEKKRRKKYYFQIRFFESFCIGHNSHQ